MNQPLTGFKLALIATLLAVVVVTLGAYTRLVDAGLGCPDWPTCYGHLWAPQTAEEIHAANTAYPHIPVNHDKTWPEMVHRYAASTLGLLAIALTVIALKNRSDARTPVKLSVFILALVIVQGIFGALTVTLKLLPQVVTAHLAGGFSTFILLGLLTLKLSGIRLRRPNMGEAITQCRRLAPVAVACVVIQILLGGWTSANYAALACPDFPKCQTAWWPETDFKQGFNLAQPVGPNYLGGLMNAPERTAIHMAHRIGAITVTVVVLTLAVLLLRSGLRHWALLIAALLALQVSLGISNVLLSLPILIAVLHNLGGAVLLFALVALTLRLHSRELHYE
ncbi:COX15/CtaA family protein [Reinekea marinisedimentorum]|uniref:Cytochrome c oxidase assembly protein subunit 15 n=1 Tax=Reinekea marinisedimentorum TaxID=230495 RepID=A0A4R3I5M6_9GAMM|nr:COX15/CtaA family protein [Reinekea marinisedimentorum]TCS40998.1 cytochrome c oxidase assembly protein subunit 15 [Reinekea marinisedimentorum]